MIPEPSGLNQPFYFAPQFCELAFRKGLVGPFISDLHEVSWGCWGWSFPRWHLHSWVEPWASPHPSFSSSSSFSSLFLFFSPSFSFLWHLILQGLSNWMWLDLFMMRWALGESHFLHGGWLSKGKMWKKPSQWSSTLGTTSGYFRAILLVKAVPGLICIQGL